MTEREKKRFQVFKAFRNGYGVHDTSKPVGERMVGGTFKRRYEADRRVRELNEQEGES